jgi:hypothetical protein
MGGIYLSAMAADSCDSPVFMRARIGENKRPKRSKDSLKGNAYEYSRRPGRESIAVIFSLLSEPRKTWLPAVAGSIPILGMGVH